MIFISVVILQIETKILTNLNITAKRISSRQLVIDNENECKKELNFAWNRREREL